jgi:predicted ATPase
MPVPRSSGVTPDHFTTFGELLRFLRRRAGFTQRELSIGVGYSESQISRLEANQRPPDEASLAARFVPALHLEVEREWTARLLELAAVSRSAAEPEERELLVATASAPHNLPIQLTSFIGRERDIAEVKRLLATSRLLTMTGAGGTGKTRLALQVAAGLLDASAFPDGVWLIELAPLAEPVLVPQSVATVLGLRETPGRPITAVLVDDLGPKRALLVLDNCEHLIAACAELAELLLRTCPRLTILATSREALGIAGESAYQVPSLSLPQPNQLNSLDAVAQSEAVRLLVERAVGVQAGFALTRANLSAVVQVCQQLDGMPLAIELAVARLRMLPLGEIAARLDDRFRLLTGGHRTALPRHQTLQALIDWSYELLTGPEQILLRRLAVFAGGWTLEAAEAVCAGDGVAAGDVFDLLGHLIDKSLVQVDRLAATGGAWYRLLETIRQYALSKLTASGEADAVRRPHAAYYLTLWEKNRGNAIGRAPRPWVDRVEMELDNLRAALIWSQSPMGNAELGLRLSGAVSPLLVGYTETRVWLEGALAHADAERAEYRQARAVALKWLAELDTELADYASARAHLTQSLMLFQKLGDSLSSAAVLERLGWTAREQGDASTARVRLADSLAIYRELGDKTDTALPLLTLGGVAVMRGDTAEAAGLLKEALALNTEMRYTEGIGWSLNHLGHVAQLQGEYELAVNLHEESLLLFREIHQHYQGVGDANQSLGETALAQGDATLATRRFREALDLFRFHGARAQVAWCLAGLAGAAVLDEEPERAACLWGAAEALRLSIGAREAPASHATRERLMAAARGQMGDTAFAAAWAEGQAASLEQAIAWATQSE